MPENILVGAESGRPVVRLDDLVVVMRLMMSGPQAAFGCLIKPRQEALARVQTFVSESNKRAIAPEQRKHWLEQLRDQVGKQDIEVYGLDPRTRAARVMVEADYRMKLVGMGLEEGVPGVQSYLASIALAPGEPPPPMGVLRWWFTLNYDAVSAAQDRRAFAIRGQGVKVESENEHLTADGGRIHTGQSDELEPASSPAVSPRISTPSARNTRSTPSCGTSSTWPWSAHWCAKRAWRTRSAGT